MQPKEEWLAEFASKPRTVDQYRYSFERFLQWAGVSDEQIVKEYEESKDREFSRKWGGKVVAYYNMLISKGLKTNSARNQITAVRSFFSSQCTSVKVKRGAIARSKMASGEHEFQLWELQKMFSVGDIQDKARLSLGLTLGWGASDFLGLSWKFLEPYLAENLEPPVAFWAERIKTGAPCRAHLTHESIESLRQYREVSNGDYVTDITVDGLNDWIRALSKKAKIEPRGHIRYHLLRKFLFSALTNSGMSELHSKIIIGKAVPVTDLTYLQSLAPALREGFMNAHSRFALVEFTNKNHNKIEDIDQVLQKLSEITEILAKNALVSPPPISHPSMQDISIIKISSEDREKLMEFLKEKSQEKNGESRKD